MAMSIEPKARAMHMHIDRLVLHGFTQIDAAALTAALQDALTRELNPAPKLNNAALPRVQTTVTLSAPCGMEQLGGALAQAIAGIVGVHQPAASPRRDTPQGGHHG